MSSHITPSPSPPPTQPIASTPGPRFLALQKIFNQALTATLWTNSYANFSECFPTPAQHCPSALEGVWRQLNTKLEEGCTREFDAIVAERTVVDGLNGWDGLVEDAARRVARGVEGEAPQRASHTLSADELHAAYLTPYLQQATQMLETRLQDSQQENLALVQQITDQRATVQNMIKGLQGLVADLENSVGAMESGPGSELEWLRVDTWSMNDEIRDAGINT